MTTSINNKHNSTTNQQERSNKGEGVFLKRNTPQWGFLKLSRKILLLEWSEAIVRGLVQLSVFILSALIIRKSICKAFFWRISNEGRQHSLFLPAKGDSESASTITAIVFQVNWLIIFRRTSAYTAGSTGFRDRTDGNRCRLLYIKSLLPLLKYQTIFLIIRMNWWHTFSFPSPSTIKWRSFRPWGV